MTMTAAKSDLEYKVDLVNRVNQAANEYQDAILERASKYVGCKILKVDGSLLKSVKDDLSSVPVPDGVSIWFDASHYSLWGKMKGHVNAECHTIYHDANIYIGQNRDGVMYELNRHRDIRKTDYTADMVRKIRLEIDRVSSELRDLEQQVACFGNRY